MSSRRAPLFTGALFAVGAALTFGMTMPFVELAGHDVGPLTTAALLYAGACLSALCFARLGRPSGTPLGRRNVPRLVAVAVVGAAIAPSLLAWGLQRTGATTSSLLLNLEAVFTVLLARAFYREPVGRRVALALALMALGGAALALETAGAPGWSALGALAVGGASFAWALDNTLTRPLADFDPIAVVAAKGGLGAALTFVGAGLSGESLVTPARALALLACGASGYGLSLRLYLLAQRTIGAARTGSIFALGPFVGAALGWLTGARSGGALTLASAALFGGGVVLHMTERHRHQHRHAPLTHAHAHRHDDGHHDHVHDPAVSGEHTHTHRHDPLDHDHEHAPDAHHSHAH